MFNENPKLSFLKLIAIIFIFFATAIAWFVLGGTIQHRTFQSENDLQSEVASLWGGNLNQEPPNFNYYEKILNNTDPKNPQYTLNEKSIEINSSNITADINLEPRKKGLIWYNTYKVNFSGEYIVKNPLAKDLEAHMFFRFPSDNAIYDNFSILINNEKIDKFDNINNFEKIILLKPNEEKKIKIAYYSQGMDNWGYSFNKTNFYPSDQTQSISQIKNFNLTINTNFSEINFDRGSLAPTEKIQTTNGWTLNWQYNNLLTGLNISLKMPSNINPGPFAERLAFFAPVSLLFFILIIFIISVIRGIDIHPLNYFFISAGFFAFHLLFAYLVDHFDIIPSFIVASAVSLILVASYLRLVVNWKFALRESMLAQFIFLVVFSASFFYEGYTGLIITIFSIIALFIMMQITGRIKWSEKFKN